MTKREKFVVGWEIKKKNSEMHVGNRDLCVALSLWFWASEWWVSCERWSFVFLPLFFGFATSIADEQFVLCFILVF